MYLLIAVQPGSSAQDITQTIRGKVKDENTKLPLITATIAVYDDSSLVTGTITDLEGNFRIESVPVGRYTLIASYIGYHKLVLSNVIVNSASEVILALEMEESPVEVEEIIVSAGGRKGHSLNRMATVSARTFSVEESERYAGSRGDPARMASNFAGVQGNDDSNNDLVIRGNSPLGVLWRVEGVNIPNPNHFGVSGTTGGPVTILNNRVLGLSDFMTGAFPAEYGNSMAGVFDLRMRNGNDERHEFSGQLGFLGTEFMAEGPLSKKNRSSYLAAYRYSTLKIIQALGINIGTDAVPKYQDLNFKLNLPLKNQGNLSFFGLGGMSGIDILASEELYPDPEKFYGEKAMDEHFRTSMGIVGVNYSKPFGNNSFVKIILSASREHQSNYFNKIERHISQGKFLIDSILLNYMGYGFFQDKFSASVLFNRKISRRQSIKTGLVQDLYNFNMDDSIMNDVSGIYTTRLDYTGTASLLQPYLQWKFKSSDKLSFIAGLHGQVLLLENHVSKALEPRLGIDYQLNQKNSFSYGTGLHSQMVPTYIYFAGQTTDLGEFVMPNSNLDFSRSIHNVLSWDYYLNSNFRIKTEAYYQYLYNIPVEKKTSSYSIIDEGHDLNRFFPDSLINKGRGHNYGIEYTLEKFFSRSYFFMLTTSLYDSKRTGSDGNYYNSVFNGSYIINLLAAREFTWGTSRRSTFNLGGKLTLAGGKRFTPVDVAASELSGETVYVDPQRNTRQFRPYFRADIKLNYRINAVNTSHEIGLDLVNVTGRQNILKQTFISGGEPPVTEEYQLGFLPLFYYRINF